MKDENGILKRIIDFIGMDTSARNESKKIVVIIRILIISCIFYFTANVVLGNLTFGKIQGLVFYGLFLFLFLGIFALSYFFSTRVILWCFNLSMLCWIFFSVHYLGWDVGAQHFLILLLLLYFFSRYRHYLSKILFAAGSCLLRLILFYFYHQKAPVWEISSVEGNALQVLNTVTIFFCISVIAFICSKDSQELEGKLVEYNSQLQKQANTDTLTGLCNRRRAMEYMDEIVQRSDKGFSLCICDIDFFKKVNDQYGHDFGDKVLKEIAAVFREEMQGRNLAARWGGEEFLLLFPECNGDEAYIKLEQIRRRIENMTIFFRESRVLVTLTYGLTEYDFSKGVEEAIKEADQKLYMGKEAGRNRIVF